MKIKKILEEKKKQMEKDLDENWFDVEVIVGEGEDGEPKRYGGRVKLTLVDEKDKREFLS